MKNKINKKLTNYSRRKKKELILNEILRVENNFNSFSDDQILSIYKKFFYINGEAPKDLDLKIFRNWCRKNNKMYLSKKVDKLLALKVFW